jgi:hypothetical protein
LKYWRSLAIGMILSSAAFLPAQETMADCASQNMNAHCGPGNYKTTSATTESSPGAPQVTYTKGQLTIAATNVSLRDVLRAVSVRTGAVIEFPAERAGERIFTRVGPGPIRAVLTDFLNGSHFNYVMLGDPTNPNSLQRLILTDAEQSVASANALPVALQNPTPEAAVKPPSPFSPPAQANAAASILPIVIPDVQPPKEQLSGEALGAMMRELAHQQRQKQQDQDQAVSPPPQ